MKRLILIRHGETDYTLNRKYCGHEDIPLNAEGIKQAECLLARLKNLKIDRVYSSDLKRAVQTAKIVFRDRVVFRRKALREVDFGSFSGLTFEKTKSMYPGIYKMWMQSPKDVKIPKGESLFNLARRVGKCFERVSNQNQKKTVALVTHGGPIRVILLKLLKLNLDKFWDIEQHVAAINIIDFENNAPKILTINDTSYLD